MCLCFCARERAALRCFTDHWAIYRDQPFHIGIHWGAGDGHANTDRHDVCVCSARVSWGVGGRRWHGGR